VPPCPCEWPAGSAAADDTSQRNMVQIASRHSHRSRKNCTSGMATNWYHNPAGERCSPLVVCTVCQVVTLRPPSCSICSEPGTEQCNHKEHDIGQNCVTPTPCAHCRSQKRRPVFCVHDSPLNESNASSPDPRTHHGLSCEYQWDGDEEASIGGEVQQERRARGSGQSRAPQDLQTPATAPTR
jgi:hypothetical protein